jgi:hypothetical protein
VSSSPAAGSGRKHRNPCVTFITGLGNSNNSPVALSEPLDPAVTGSFAVLRRPSLPEDVLPPINPLGEDLGYQLRGYFPGEIRQLVKDAEGDRYFLIPGFERGYLVPPAQCLPKRERHLHAQLVADQRKRELEPVYCLEDMGPHRPRYGGASCLPFSAIQSGQALADTAGSRTDVLELAPDGVATVRLSYRSGDVLNAAVSNNVFTFTPPQKPIKQAIKALRSLQPRREPSNGRQRSAEFKKLLAKGEALSKSLVPQTVQWIDASGRLIRSYSPPTRGSLVALALAPFGDGSSSSGGFTISTG